MGRYASIVAAGFRPAVHNERRLREHLGATPAGTLERFRAVVGSTTTPSKHLVAYLDQLEGPGAAELRRRVEARA